MSRGTFALRFARPSSTNKALWVMAYPQAAQDQKAPVE
jgi:hypothetical protein